MPTRSSVRRRAFLLAAAVLVGLTPGLRAQDDPSGPFRLTFLDVGQGDAALLQSPDGKTALVDAGRERGLADRLRARGIERIDLLVASHADADHIGGMLDVVRGIPVRYFLDNGVPHLTQTYLSLMRDVHARPGITYLNATPRTMDLGGAEIRVLPIPPQATGEEDQNDTSVGLVVSWGSFRAFLSGDSERRELSWWLERGDVPSVTVLKAPHHGSDNGFTPAFLETAHPDVVVVSVGPNDYGHPMPAALAAYGSIAKEVLRTDHDGTVTIVGYRDGRFEVTTERRSGPTPTPRASTSVGRTGRSTAPTGTTQWGSAATASMSVGLFVVADAPGNDHDNLNGEYVTLTNHADHDASLAGSRICDAAPHCFLFPPGAVLRPDGLVVVFTGSGRDDATHFYMGRRRAVWNNDGDTATLYDAFGRVIGRYAYD